MDNFTCSVLIRIRVMLLGIMVIAFTGCTKNLQPVIHPSPSSLSTLPAVAKQLTSCNIATTPPLLKPSDKSSGTLLFQVGSEVLAIDAATLKQQVLIHSDQIGAINVVGMSENGIWLGFISEPPLQNNQLSVTILSSKGQLVTHAPTVLLPVPDKSVYGWAGYGWIGNQLMMIGFNNGDSSINGLVDPFNGNWQQSLLDELPNKYHYPEYSGIALSPDLTRALYIQTTLSTENPILVLWNITDHRELWRMKFHDLPSPKLVGLLPSAWSPDSNVIAFAYNDSSGDEKVFILNRDGASLTVIPNLSPEDHFVGMAWSMDNRYLAFYADKPISPSLDVYKDDIVIYDRTTRSTTVLCSLDNLEDDNLTAHIIPNRLVWSPDGQYLIYGIGSLMDQTNLIVENIFTGEAKAFKPGSRFYNLIGWSNFAWAVP